MTGASSEDDSGNIYLRTGASQSGIAGNVEISPGGDDSVSSDVRVDANLISLESVSGGISLSTSSVTSAQSGTWL